MMLWSTVLNAADISSIDRRASWPDYMALPTYENALRGTVSVEWACQTETLEGGEIQICTTSHLF